MSVQEDVRVPRSVADLSAIAEAVQRGSDRRLGRRALAALVSMLQQPHRTAVQNISQIAQEAKVDPSTLTRLGQRLGFSGFTDLQEIFRKYVAERGLFYSSQAENLMARDQPGSNGSVRDLANQEIRKLVETSAAIDQRHLDRATRLICNAQVVYVLGLRATHAVAYFFAAFAHFLRPRVVMLGASGAAFAEELAQISENDVLVAVSFRPYTQMTVDACVAMRKRDIPVVALTDLSSPIAADTSKHVTIRARGAFYFNSALPHFFIVQALLSEMAHHLGPEVVKHMNSIESLLKEMSIEQG